MTRETPDMVDKRTEFLALLDRAKAGCETARTELYEQFRGFVLHMVRRKLHRRMRSQYDSSDFTQAIWASFFQLPAERCDFADSDELIDFLASLATNKVTTAIRRKLGAQENLNRELFLEDVSPPEGMEGTPSQNVIAGEQWRLILAAQNPAMKEVLVLLREGYTYDEVAKRTGIHPKAIQRRVKRLTERLYR